MNLHLNSNKTEQLLQENLKIRDNTIFRICPNNWINSQNSRERCYAKEASVQ